ncbi:MAG: MFS transporter [Anaerolineales bacterium]|jgi:predicted MFS family arabinose efflux permease
MKPQSRYRWFVVVVFFIFMLLHQSDKLLIGPLTTPIMETYGIDEVQMGAVFTGALLVGAILYPIWGYLYDRYARSKLLSLASFIWGSTTWLSAIAPTYPLFLASRATTGIDDSSYPGIYSLISDYFGPNVRGKVYGLLQLTQPLGYMAGLLIATYLGLALGWRSVFYITGGMGLILAVVIFLVVKDAPRGQSEPEMSGLEQVGIYRFEWKTALNLFRKPSLVLLFIQGFVGVFPWNVITYWFFRYLETERGYSSNEVLFTMAPAILVLAAGYFVGGAIGDFFFKRTPRGRMMVSTVAVLLGAILLSITLNIPVGNQTAFVGMLMVTALFIPFASANVVSTVYDVTLPEVRSTALAIENFIENGGAALAPLLAGIIAKGSSLGNAILTICVSAWVIGSIFLALTTYLIPRDIETLRNQMSLRAREEKALQAIAD